MWLYAYIFIYIYIYTHKVYKFYRYNPLQPSTTTPRLNHSVCLIEKSEGRSLQPAALWLGRRRQLREKIREVTGAKDQGSEVKLEFAVWSLSILFDLKYTILYIYVSQLFSDVFRMFS